jgi:glutamate dehydrogenase
LEAAAGSVHDARRGHANQVDDFVSSPQDEIVQATVRLAVRASVWLLHHRDALRDLAATLARLSPGVAEVGAGLDGWLGEQERAVLDADTARWVAQGVPEALAQRVVRLEAQFSGLDIVEVAAETLSPIDVVAVVYFGVGGRLSLGWLMRRIAALAADSHWQGMARVALRDDLTALARALAQSVLRGTTLPASDAQSLIEQWEAQREFQLARCRQLLDEVRSAPAVDMAMLSVMLRELRALV